VLAEGNCQPTAHTLYPRLSPPSAWNSSLSTRTKGLSGCSRISCQLILSSDLMFLSPEFGDLFQRTAFGLGDQPADQNNRQQRTAAEIPEGTV
jgi:hypothetical protein